MLVVHSLLWWNREQKVLQLELQFFWLMGLWFFLCHIHLDEVQTLSFLNWNDTSRTSYNLWKKQDLLLGYVHASHSAVWNKVSDGTAECRQHLPWPLYLNSPESLLVLFFFLSNGNIKFSSGLGNDVYIFFFVNRHVVYKLSIYISLFW